MVGGRFKWDIIIVFKFNRSMRSDIVTIEPQVVQFGREGQQTIKIINNTASAIPNFFFCLYNTEKFTFTPDSFSLAPLQHKLVTITLRLKAARSAAREFAYLKSSQINRRITLLVNGFSSPQPKQRPEEGVEEANTLSSREYNEVQNEAIERIIREKQAYIQLLERERDAAHRMPNFRTEESAEKGGLRRELEQMEMRLILAENQKQGILRENLVLQEKFEEYRKYCEGDLKSYEKVRSQLAEQTAEVAKLHEEVQYLEAQAEQYIKKLEEKEARIRQLDIHYKRSLQDQKRQNDKRTALIQARIEQQRQSYNQTSRQSQDRIRELKQRLQTSQKFKLRSSELERELRRRQQQIRDLTSAMQSQRNTMRELQSEKKRLLKVQVMNESMTQKNSELSARIRDLQKVNHNLKEEVMVYKSKIAERDHSNDKISQYVETAMQSLKGENQALKRIRKEQEQDIAAHLAANRQAQDQNKILSEQLAKSREENGLLQEIKESWQRKCEELRQEHHLALMKLKTENIELLEKLSSGEATRREQRIAQLEESLRRTEDELVLKARELERFRVDLSEQTAKGQALIEQNARLAEKVRRYKKQARRELRSINETAVSQLHKTSEENKQMAMQITQLQAVIAHYDCQRLKEEKESEPRAKSGGKSAGKSNHGRSSQKRPTEESQVRKERVSSRAIGIKDQRREIQESSKAYSQTSHQEHVYSELGELRQLNNFLKNEEERLGRLLDLQGQDPEDSLIKEERAVFRAVRFFKRIQAKVRDLRGESQLSSIKQVQFLKGRIRQLQCLREQNANNSSVSLSKTREQLADLLQFVREEMRNQYKKLNDHIKLAEQKHQLLKRKIYEQYRAKIIQALGRKEKGNLQQLQLTLQRFIDAMSNLSHKQAVLHKEVKLKQHARKQNIELKEKVTSLNHLLQTKKGYCSRDPLKLLYSEAEQEWQESLKREAQLLTLSAEYQRLREQFSLLSEELAEAKLSNARMEKELDERSSEVLKLKRYQIDIQTNYENQLQKQYEIIEENKRRIMEFTKTGKQPKQTKEKEREYHNLKDNLEKQKDVIRVLREKEKMLEEILEESHRAEEKERRKANEQSRVAESIRDLKDSNRELRADNAKLKEKLTKLQEQLQKKSTYLKNLKGDIEENRIRVQRKDESEAQRLREEGKRLTEQLKRARDQLQKAKKKRDKEIAQHKNEVDRIVNQNLINVKSLESVVRALMDNLRDIYGRLRYYVKKRKGMELEDHHALFDTSRTVNIDGLKINQAFEKALVAIEGSE